MWIKSQDKTKLGEYKELVIVGNSIFGYSNMADDSTMLGEYETKERAIEVLDQIQRRIQIIEDEKLDCMFYDGKFEKPNGTDKTFEMPEK